MSKNKALYRRTRIQPNGAVRYWSVHQQQWKVAFYQQDVSTEDMNELNDKERSDIYQLPLEASEEEKKEQMIEKWKSRLFFWCLLAVGFLLWILSLP